ncbi:MAG: hypothetical protein HQ582_07900 [Planctomycetes bacterium]|nr:hypothetical protein [Planctomycetota bacterium]
MGYALLWLETVVGELLLLTTLVALVGRIKWPRLRMWLFVALVIVALASYAALFLVVGWAESKRLAADGWGNPARLLAILCAAGALLITFLGSRGTGPDRRTSAASRWPRAKLAVALLVVLALNMMTFWNLDAAVHQRVDSLRVEAGALAVSVAPPRVSDRDNAALIYERAFELMGTQKAWDEQWNPKWADWLSQGNDEFDPDDAELRKFLAEKAPALPELRNVVEKPACYFRYDYARPDVATLLPNLTRFRHARQLLALDARSRAAAGDFETAADDLNAMFAMVEHAGTIPVVIGMLVAGAVDELATETLEAVLASGQFPSEGLSHIQVPATVSFGRFFDRATVMEEAFGLSCFYEYGAPLNLRGLFDDHYSSRQVWWCSQLAPAYRVFCLDDDAACYRAHMAEAKRLAARPFFEVAEDWKQYEDGVQRDLRGLLSHLILPAMHAAAKRAAGHDARHRLAQFAEAVPRHRGLPGDISDHLDALASIIRPDPFDGKPLKWILTDEAIILYSIGPDLTDDGGKPFEKESETGDLTFTLPK